MPEKIAILKESGETLNTNIVSIFTIPEIQKKFLITTENAVDPHGLTVLHVSEIIGDELSRVSTDDEWSSIKNIMRSIISGSVGSYQFQPLITSAKARTQYSRDISVSATACKQISDSYAAALKNLNKSDETSTDKKEEEKKETANDENSAQSSSSSIFPSNVSVEDEENEVSPGISEVDEKTPETKDETPIVVTDESLNPTKVSVENDENKEDEVTPDKDEDKKEEVSKEKKEETPEKIEEVIDDQIVLVEDEKPSEDTKEKTKSSSSVEDKDLDSIIESSKEAFVNDLNDLINKIADKITKEISEKEKKLAEREALIEEREKLVNDLIANLSKPKDS